MILSSHLIWNWAKRQHPNKGLRWINKKYFRQVGSQKWVFSIKNKKGYETRFLLSSIPIKRHSLIKGTANPYDQDWKGYFEARKNLEFSYRKPATFEILNKRQGAICPLCQQEIELPKRGIIHYPHDNIVTDKNLGLQNAVLVHNRCHKENLGYGF